MGNSHMRILMLAASMLVMGYTAPAIARDAPKPSDTGAAATPTSDTPSDKGSLGDIVVTAERRSQNLLTVPMSISALTGLQLQDQGIKEITSLQFTTPGFLPENGVGYVQVFMRGIGNNLYVGTGPSVTTYIDDVPRIFASQVNSFADVERVEVLKGAQGGLYGNNSTGGVINIITRQPGDKLAADATVSYGAKRTLDAKAYFNVPLSDNIAWNFAFTRESHDPYIKNVTQNPAPYTAAMFPNNGSLGSYGGIVVNPFGTGAATAALFNSGVKPPSGLGNQNFFAVESKLQVKPTDDLKITLAGDYSKKNDGEGDQWVSISDPAALQAYFTNILIPYVAGIYQPCGPYKCAATNFPAGLVQTGEGKWTTASSVPALATLQDYGGSGKIEWQLPGVALTSITAYREQQTLYSNDSGTDNLPWVVPIVSNSKWYFYQEVRAVSTNDGPIHFIAGATYLREHVHYNTVIDYFNLFPGAVTDSNHDNHNWSVYGQLGYDFTDKLNLTVSGRYVSLKDQAVFDSPAADPTVPYPAPTSAVQKNSKFLPSATLSYNTGGGVIYARYAEGFKEGGINPVVSPASFVDETPGAGGHVSPGFQFGPETVNTIEIGARGKLFDNKIQYTTAVFYNSYTGLQATTVGDNNHPGIIEAILNAGSARTYGIEGSLTWRPIDVLTIGANAGYLNAKYKSYKQTDATTGLQTFDLSGQQMIYAPTLQAGINADLDQPISDKLNFVGSTLISHISKTIQGEIPYLVVQPGYWLVNMRVGVRTVDKRIGVFLFVNNLFDTFYTTFGSSSSLGASQVEGDPRIIGGEVQIKF